MASTGKATGETSAAPSCPPVESARWYRQVTSEGWRALVAAGSAWLFEVFDVMLLSLTTPALLVDFGVSKAQIGLLGTVQATGMIIGGILGGGIADRIGRVKTLSYATALYAIFTGLITFAPSLAWLELLRFLGALGMGATWSAGAALLAETWPPQHRGKSGALMQAGLPLGTLLTLGVTALITAIHGGLQDGGWRVLYALGALPIVFAVYIRLRTPESATWKRQQADGTRKVNVRLLFRRSTRAPLFLALLFTFFGQYLFWGVVSFLPTYLVQVNGMTLARSIVFLLIQQAGTIVGFVGFASLVDRWGRRPTFVCYLLLAISAILLLTAVKGSGAAIVASFLAGAGVMGIVAGVGPWAAEMVHSSPVRALSMGFIYNGGRVGGAIAPSVIGTLAISATGFKLGLLTAAAAAAAGIVTMLFAPETKGRELLTDGVD